MDLFLKRFHLKILYTGHGWKEQNQKARRSTSIVAATNTMSKWEILSKFVFTLPWLQNIFSSSSIRFEKDHNHFLHHIHINQIRKMNSSSRNHKINSLLHNSLFSSSFSGFFVVVCLVFIRFPQFLVFYCP